MRRLRIMRPIGGALRYMPWSCSAGWLDGGKQTTDCHGVTASTTEAELLALSQAARGFIRQSFTTVKLDAVYESSATTRRPSDSLTMISRAYKPNFDMWIYTITGYVKRFKVKRLSNTCHRTTWSRRMVLCTRPTAHLRGCVRKSIPRLPHLRLMFHVRFIVMSR
jgi:hypothetical protein